MEEEGIPGHHCHQYHQSSAAPWGSLNLISLSDWDLDEVRVCFLSTVHLRTCLRVAVSALLIVQDVCQSVSLMVLLSCLKCRLFFLGLCQRGCENGTLKNKTKTKKPHHLHISRPLFSCEGEMWSCFKKNKNKKLENGSFVGSEHFFVYLLSFYVSQGSKHELHCCPLSSLMCTLCFGFFFCELRRMREFGIFL